MLACSAGCSSDPGATLAELPALQMPVSVQEFAKDGDSEPTIRFAVALRHSRDDCPRIEGDVSITANGIPLQFDRGGPSDMHVNGCSVPHAWTLIERPRDLSPDLVVEVRDETTIFRKTFPGLLAPSSIEVVAPTGPLVTADTVRVRWMPQDLRFADSVFGEAALMMVDEPFTESRVTSNVRFVEDNEIRFSVPEWPTWTGPTQLTIRRVQFTQNAIECTGTWGLCMATREASASTIVDLTGFDDRQTGDR